MPDQPADPIHYDMKIPPEPKEKDDNGDSPKKHGDKIDTGEGTGSSNTEHDEKNGTA